jgi:transcriptional regulator with XRE-family HTH domain
LEQPVNIPPPASFGALLRARRHRAYLSQEQLAARAELSERTVRNLEADRVRSPRTDTLRLLANALRLSESERDIWLEAARGRPAGQSGAGVASQPGQDAGTRDGGGLADADGRELAELRRENRRLREDVEILERAAAVFAAAACQGGRSPSAATTRSAQRLERWTYELSLSTAPSRRSDFYQEDRKLHGDSRQGRKSGECVFHFVHRDARG